MEFIRKHKLLIVLLLVAVSIGGCDQLMAADTGALEASGVVEAVEVLVAPEVGGRVAEVYVAEGEQVQKGDPLVSIESDILNAQ
jgi:HlyD family secretion protein